MRQWNIEPQYLCNKHLFGEHFDHHVFLGLIKKKKKLNGYLKHGLLNPYTLKERHDLLANEIIKRGYNHFSELEHIDPVDLEYIDFSKYNSINADYIYLFTKCNNCRNLFLRKNIIDFAF